MRFFLYCCRVAAGLKEKVLADIFKVSVSTVSRIIITWASYLYLVLGSLPIWMSREQVNSTMPDKFRQFCPEVRVIIDCTEIRCQNPSSLTLQSEVFSSYKNTTTFKGLIGIAPCGAVTFVPSLYTGSISDQELTKQSGILEVMLVWLTKDSPLRRCWQNGEPNSSYHLLKQQLSSAKKMQREHKPLLVFEFLLREPSEEWRSFTSGTPLYIVWTYVVGLSCSQFNSVMLANFSDFLQTFLLRTWL